MNYQDDTLYALRYQWNDFTNQDSDETISLNGLICEWEDEKKQQLNAILATSLTKVKLEALLLSKISKCR